MNNHEMISQAAIEYGQRVSESRIKHNLKVVNVEVQKANDDDHQRRVRYNGALLTTNSTDPNEKFRAVPDVIVIFISRFDVFKSGKTLYHIDRIIRETGKVIYNGFAEVYVNAEVDDKSDAAELMSIFTKDEAYDYEKFPATSKRKRRFKTTEEGVSEMCDIIEKYKAEGKIEGKIEEVKGMLKDGLVSLETVRNSGRYTPQELAAIEAP